MSRVDRQGAARNRCVLPPRMQIELIGVGGGAQSKDIHVPGDAQNNHHSERQNDFYGLFFHL